MDDRNPLQRAWEDMETLDASVLPDGMGLYPVFGDGASWGTIEARHHPDRPQNVELIFRCSGDSDSCLYIEIWAAPPGHCLECGQPLPEKSEARA